MYTPEITPPKKKEERRIKVALKERPKAKKNAAIENKAKPTEVAPPMPKGKQLEKIVEPKSKPLPKPSEQIKAKQPRPVEPQKKVPTPKKVTKKPPPPKKPEPVPPKKPYIPIEKPPVKPPEPKPEKVVRQDVNRTEEPKVPKEHKGLFAKLSKKQKNIDRTIKKRDPSRRESRINQDLKELYGDEFGKLSEGEQKYLLDNQEIMRRITQQVLNRVGRVNIPSNMRVNADNVIEFYLYPNGDISEIKFIKRSGFYLLDDTTKETIEYAYSRYPRPKQKTLVRYKVGYFLRGY
jgi:outer membrane biosynthesis protein TonB